MTPVFKKGLNIKTLVPFLEIYNVKCVPMMGLFKTEFETCSAVHCFLLQHILNEHLQYCGHGSGVQNGMASVRKEFPF